jgi:uncharacterized membrane protein YgcG
MKKFFLCLSAAFLSLTFANAVFAEEKIIDFASSAQVHKNGSVIVEEVITVNAEHIKIRRGLYRDIANAAAEPSEFISLYMDNEKHPAFTEMRGNYLRINFGNDDDISKGLHTYRLTYSAANIVKDFPDYDEVYWNVTGSGWEFPIEHASFHISLPPGADIKDDLVSMYTGKKGSKASKAIRSGDFFFETTSGLSAGEGFTVAVPFEKGIVKSHKKAAGVSFASLGAKGLICVSAGLLLFVFFFIYFIVSWLAVGRDPKDVIVTEFAPPEGISPAFMRSLWNRGNDRKMFAAALVSLAMKDKISITEERVVFQKTAVLKLKDKNAGGLAEEEKYIIDALFSSRDEFSINRSNWAALSSCMKYIENGFNLERKKYILSNKKYILPAVLILVLFQLLFIPLGSAASAYIFINLHYAVFLLVFAGLSRSMPFKIIAFVVLNLFYSVFFFGIGAGSEMTAAVVEIFFILSFWALLIYINIIDNLTEEGRELFKRIKGFHKYMTIAEEHRVSASVPVDDEKIFADYLPYAFAFGMENKWMERFEKVLSRAAIERCTYNIGGTNAFTRGFIVSSINSAAPSNSAGSGSGGGGSSGGGSGGGGGGGR